MNYVHTVKIIKFSRCDNLVSLPLVPELKRKDLSEFLIRIFLLEQKDVWKQNTVRNFENIKHLQHYERNIKINTL